MRLARYAEAGGARLALVEGDRLVPLRPEVALLDLLGAAPEQRERLAIRADEPARAAGEVRLLAPLAPRTIRDYVTFEEHVEGVRASVDRGRGVPEAWYGAPTFYFTNPHAVTGPFDDVAVPPGCELLDFELEVAAVIGRDGRDLPPAEADGHIAAYTIYNDWSARDLQRREMQVGLGPAKGKDFANTLGPWLVTADELEPYRRDDRLDLDLRVWVNGEEVGDDTLANMGWSFAEMAAYASRGTGAARGRRAGLGHLRVRLPGRAVGPPRPARAAAAAAGRRGADGRRGDRGDRQPRRGGRRAGARARGPATAPAPAALGGVA